MTMNTTILDGYVTAAAAAKSAFVAAQATARTADQAWTSGLLYLGLVPVLPTRPGGHSNSPTPTPIAVTDLPGLASAKISADAALATARAANTAAQQALTQALQTLGAQ